MIVGIDYSINSPGLCFFDGEKVQFGTLARNGVCSGDFKNLLIDHDVFTWDLDKYKAVGNTVDDAQGFTHDSMRQAFGLKQICYSAGMKDFPENTENIAVFEGFSFGSKGNRLAQLAGYQYVARAELLSSVVLPQGLYVYAPQSIKSVAGAAKRGEGKVGMIQRFIQHEDKLHGLEDHPFYIEMCKNEDSLFRKKPSKRKPVGDWVKPVDDIIDAYWILYTYIKKNNVSL